MADSSMAPVTPDPVILTGSRLTASENVPNLISPPGWGEASVVVDALVDAVGSPVDPSSPQAATANARHSNAAANFTGFFMTTPEPGARPRGAGGVTLET